MKKFPNIILLLLLLLSSSRCRDYFELRKPSLVIRHYDGPYQWGGITLGESTIEETRELLKNVEEVLEDTIDVGERYKGVDEAIFVDFEEGFRESSLCIWFIDGKAQIMEFFGAYLKLSEIQENLGELEQISALLIREETSYIRYYGISQKIGYVVHGSPNIDRNNIENVSEVKIDSTDIVYINLINPDFLPLILDIDLNESIRQYLFEEGGFQDWHGYGEYEVQRPAFLN